MISRERVLERKAATFIHSLALFVCMLGLLAALGWLIAGVEGLVAVFVIGGVFVVVGPRVTPALVLRLHRARPLAPPEAPALFRAVTELAARAELPRPPALYYQPSQIINAFAVGRHDDSAICLSDGLLRALNQAELVGVLAHEISHISNRDLWMMGLADAVSRLTCGLSWMGQLLLLVGLPMAILGDTTFPWLLVRALAGAPILSFLLQLALSRTREYDADLDAATLTGNPRGLASALAKMERLRGSWFERLLLSGRRPQAPSVLRTHPDTGDRIRRLLELEAGRRPDREGDDRRWGHNRPRRSRPPIIPGRELQWRVRGPDVPPLFSSGSVQSHGIV
jgi:heat shock protein HtpX